MKTDTPMMKCGHAANAECEGKPVCVICAGIVDGAYQIDDDPPSLDGRTAICLGCKRTPAISAPSSTNLAFFQHHPNKQFDSFYCGCWGWN